MRKIAMGLIMLLMLATMTSMVSAKKVVVDATAITSTDDYATITPVQGLDITVDCASKTKTGVTDSDGNLIIKFGGKKCFEQTNIIYSYNAYSFLIPIYDLAKNVKVANVISLI